MRRVLTVVLSAALLAGCGGGETSSGDGDPDDPATTVAGGEVDPNAVVIYIAEGSVVNRVLPGSEETTELVSGLTDAFQTWALDGSIWVAQSDGRLLRIHPDSGEIELDIPTGAYVAAIDVGDGFLWVLNGQQGLETVVNKIDLATGEIAATVVPDAGAYFTDIAFGEGSLWAIGGDPLSVAVISQIDPGSASVVDMFDVGMVPDQVAVGMGSVWAVGAGFTNPDGTGNPGMDLVRVDPATNEVAERLDVSEGDGIPDLATAYDSVWLTDTLAGELVRVSSDGMEIQSRIAIGSGGQDLYEIDIAKGQVWAGNPFEGRIYAINPTTNEFEIGIDGLAEGIAFAP